MNPYYDDGTCVIYHGDCREIVDDLNDDDVRADVVIADPPYGETSLEWDRWPHGWVNDVASLSSDLWSFGSMRMFLSHAADFEGWRIAQDIVWEKQNGTGFAVDRFKRVHECIVQFYRGRWSELQQEVPRVQMYYAPNKSTRSRGETPHTGKIADVGYDDDGTRLMRSVWRVQNEQAYAHHPTQKPLGVVTPLIEFSCPSDGLVLDPFMGSGTTLRAAKDLGRKAIGIEVSERYCEIAAKRLGQEVMVFG